MNTKVDSGTNFSQKYIYGLTFLFFCGWLFVYANRTVLYPMLPFIGDEFGLSNAQIGMLTSAYFIAYIGMQVPAGLLGDRMGLRLVLGISMVLAGVTLTLVGLVVLNYWLLLILIGLHGLVAGAYYANVFGAAMVVTPEKNRSVYTAFINAGIAVGLALGLIVAGPLFLKTGSWRYPFLFLSIPTIFLGIVYLLYLRDIDTTKPDFSGIRILFRHKNVVLLWVAMICLSYGYWMLLTWGPTFFEAERGVSLNVAGLFTAIPALVALPFSFLWARVARNFGRRRLLMILSLLSVITLSLLIYTKSFTILIVALVAYGITGRLAMDPLLISWYGEYALKSCSNSMATAMGLLNFAVMLTSIVAPPISGWLRDWSGSLDSGFYLGTFVVFIGFLALAFTKE